MDTTPATPPPAPLPEGVHLETEHDVPVIHVDTPASRARIHLDGAQVTSWIPADRTDVLWTSPEAREGEGQSIRGGIPLIGPWFGPGRSGDRSPAHGWLRSVRWHLVAAERIGEAVTLVLEPPAGADPSGQGITARAFVSVAEHLTVELTVRAGSEPLELESALHTYLAVGDVRGVRVEDLDGAFYLDNRRGLERARQEGPLVIDGALDRVYEVAEPVRIIDPVGGRAVIEEPRGSTRTVVWNPGAEGAADLPDMPEAAWTDFVCVETAACKDGAIMLDPGAAHALRVRLILEEN